MYLRRDQFTRITRAPAKLNLYLEILGRRADGFHELETLMVPIALADSLEFTPTSAALDCEQSPIDLEVCECYAARLSESRPTVPTGNENLVVRALELLRERSGCAMGARLRLVKRIPAAAGLGGGSSDAAVALRLANSMWELNWPVKRLMELGAEIGSDVPFFLAGGPALCLGRGERVERIFNVPRRWFVIVKPPAELSTSDVYRALDLRTELTNPHQAVGLIPAAGSYGTSGILQARRWMFNRLQLAAASISPWVERLRRAFDRLDFLGHQLSGSGSAYFGVCRHAQHARRLATILRTQQLGLVYATRSCA